MYKEFKFGASNLEDKVANILRVDATDELIFSTRLLSFCISSTEIMMQNYDFYIQKKLLIQNVT